MNFRDKHVFLISDVDKFFYLFADALVHKCDVPADSIVAVVYKSGRTEALDRKEPFKYIDFDICEPQDLLLSKNFISLSLMTWNASIIKKLIQIDHNFLNKIHIFITDDEVDRWLKTKTKYGGLSVNEPLYISEDVLFVAKNVKNFIGPKSFGGNLEEILCRDNIKIIDASAIFDILPCRESENLRMALFSRGDVPANRVMIGTKSTGLREAIRAIHALRETENMQFLIFEMPVHKRIFLDLYLLINRIILKRKTSIMYLQYLLPLAYNAIVASCSYLVLQRRGGGSTARLFAKWGCGQIIAVADSENSKVLREIFGVEYIEFNNNMSFNAGSKIAKEVVSKNAVAVISEEMRSIEVLKKFFNLTQS